MCGIAGIWHLNGEKLAVEKLKKFTDSMVHRGPDGAGYELFDNNALGLGQRRLSILDLSEAGRQPMAYDNGRYQITYNGEIFNFIELRKELETKGYQFVSQTDTEVILAAFKAWGPECMHRFIGMWAFAIWDNTSQTLFMARDRFGIKPFYYTYVSGQLFAFASETIAFRQLQDFKPRISDANLRMQLRDNYVLEGQGYSIYENVWLLLPGHYMQMGRDTIPQQKRWYDIRDSFQKKNKMPYEAQVVQFTKLLESAITIRLRSDVKIGTALSGGLDSSTIYSVLSRLKKSARLERLPDDWHTAFVQTFPGAVNDETAYAREVVEFCDGKAEYLVNDNVNLKEDIISTTLHSDTIANNPLISISNIYKGMREKGVTVSLDGHGVDEMLYGYLDSVYKLYTNNKWLGSRKETEETTKVLAGMYHPTYVNDMQTQLNEDIGKVFALRGSLKSRVKRIFKKPELKGDEHRIYLPPLSDKPYIFNQLSEHLLYEFFVHTLPSLLISFDKAAMLNSVEIRMPFLDYRMVEFLFSLPDSSKIGAGYTKRIMRDAMKDKLPENIRTRKFKVGIGAPLVDWLNDNLNNWAIETLDTSGHLLFNKDKMLQLREDLSRKQVNETDAVQIWQLINYSLLKQSA